MSAEMKSAIREIEAPSKYDERWCHIEREHGKPLPTLCGGPEDPAIPAHPMGDSSSDGICSGCRRPLCPACDALYEVERLLESWTA